MYAMAAKEYQEHFQDSIFGQDLAIEAYDHVCALLRPFEETITQMDRLYGNL